MRIPALALLLTTGLPLTGSVAHAQQPNSDGTVSIDTYWLRTSGAKTYDDIEPFRVPMGVKDNIPAQARDLITDLTEMLRLSKLANHLQLTIDPDGREICSIKSWTQAYENVKANGLNMEGWLGKILREDDRFGTRQACIYGMFYFNDPHKIIQLISNLPGEPLSALREDGFERALRYMRVYYKESKPLNPKYPDSGIVVPRYEFNPLPFFLLLDQKKGVDQAQGLWFLSEVLKIRRDLGRIYLEELRDRILKLLVSEDKLVRKNAVAFLAAIDKNQKRVPTSSATDAELKEWYKALDYELFPPIRHVSSGRCDLYPSEELEELIKVGKRILVPVNFPPGSARLRSGTHRYGIRLGRLPEPLNKLGLPINSVIVSINNHPIGNAKRAREVLVDFFAEIEKAAKAAKKRAKATGKAPPPRKIPTIQVEYIFKKRAFMKEFRLLR